MGDRQVSRLVDPSPATKQIYMYRAEPSVNDLGSVATPQGRCIAFPNIYQHQVQSFSLLNKSKPGHRKILALFLVDPAILRPSTTTVPPQQQVWGLSAVAADPALRDTIGKLPVELVNRIDELVDGKMTLEEAKKYRLELMDERTAFVKENNEKFFGAPFSLCEH
jgi:hypothetical protein